MNKESYNFMDVPKIYGIDKTEGYKMSSRNTTTFQDALDVIESLPETQQEDLINLIRRRLVEQRREKIIKGVRGARREYARGEVKKGSLDDLMRDLSE